MSDWWRKDWLAANVRASSPRGACLQVCHTFCPFHTLTDVLRNARAEPAHSQRVSLNAAIIAAIIVPTPAPITTPVCCCSRSPARSAPPSPVPTPPASTATMDRSFLGYIGLHLPFRLAPPRRTRSCCLEASAVAAAARIGRPTRPSPPGCLPSQGTQRWVEQPTARAASSSQTRSCSSRSKSAGRHQ